MRSEPISNIDSAILNVEDPTAPDTMGLLLLFDGKLDESVVRERIENAWLRYPRYRQRIRELPFGRRRWVEDPTFDISAHFRRVAVPAPHDTAALSRTVGDLMAMLLDRSKPLWTMHLIEGGPGGDALLVRMHHAIGDGITLFMNGLGLFKDSYILETEDKRRGLVERIFDPLVEVVGATQSLRDMLREPGGGLLPSPSKLLSTAEQALELGIKLFPLIQDPPTSLTGELTRRKMVAWTPPVPAKEYKRVARALGVSSNDLALALIAGALRRYFIAQGESLPGVLHASVPVYLSEKIRLGNNFGLVLAPLPIGEADPYQRVRDIHDAMKRLKKSPEAAIVSRLFNAAGNLPPSVVQRLFDEVSRKASLVVTNVPGPPFKLDLGGTQLRHVVPIVPLSGHIGLGIAIVTYNRTITLGIQADGERIKPSLVHFINLLRAELALLTELADEALNRSSGLCSALTREGRRCRNRARKGHHTCYVHRALEEYETVEPKPERPRRAARRRGERRNGRSTD